MVGSFTVFRTRGHLKGDFISVEEGETSVIAWRFSDFSPGLRILTAVKIQLSRVIYRRRTK